MFSRACTLLIASLVFAACTRAMPEGRVTKESPGKVTVVAPPVSDADRAVAPAPAELDPRFVGDVKDLFTVYRAYGRTDDETRWAPWLCRMPLPGTPRMSGAEDGGHARKLYSLFAADRGAYVALGDPQKAKPPAVGQVIAKESYIPELLTPEQAALVPHRGVGGVEDVGNQGGNGNGGSFDPYMREGDKIYKAKTFAGVYVMIKKPEATPGTDNGWVYGTMTASGEVTSAGRVASCMGCHTSAKHDRLFGLIAKRGP